MNEKTGLSIIVPCFNPQYSFFHFLQKVVDSTPLFPFEFVLVDDCSSENFSSYLPFSPKVRLIYNESNIGPAKSRLFGIANSTYSHIAFLDCDDEFADNFFSEIWNYGVFGFDLFCFGHRSKNSSIVHLPLGSVAKEVAEDDIFFKSCVSGTMGYICSKIVRKSIIASDNELFTNRIDLFEDMLFNLCFFVKKNLRIFYLGEALYVYQQSENGLSSKMNCSRLNSLIEFERSRISFLNRHHFQLTNIQLPLNRHFLSASCYVIKRILYSGHVSFLKFRKSVNSFVSNSLFIDAMKSFSKRDFAKSDRFILLCISRHCFLTVFCVCGPFYFIKKRFKKLFKN